MLQRPCCSAPWRHGALARQPGHGGIHSVATAPYRHIGVPWHVMPFRALHLPHLQEPQCLFSCRGLVRFPRVLAPTSATASLPFHRITWCFCHSMPLISPIFLQDLYLDDDEDAGGVSKDVVLPTLPTLLRLVLVVNSYLDILQVWQGVFVY